MEVSVVQHERRSHPLRWIGGLRKILGRNGGGLSLIPRERRFYDLFEQQAATIVQSAGLLEQALADVADLPRRQREIKDLEHQGDEITNEIVRALNNPDVREKFAASGFDPGGSSPEQFSAHIRSEIAKWKRLVKEANLQLHQG